MAGGEHAAIVPCLKCTGPAHRTTEGLENDSYLCAVFGFALLIDWPYEGPPRTHCWPISEEEAGRRHKVAAQDSRCSIGAARSSLTG